MIDVPPCVAGHFFGCFYVYNYDKQSMRTISMFNFNVKIGAFIEHIFMVLYEVSCGGSRMTAL